MKILLLNFKLLFGLLLLLAACSHPSDHNYYLNGSIWHAEDDSDELCITILGDTLDIVSPGGMTLWYSKQLKGNYEISYDASMPMQGSEVDRLSDLNCFWGAKDPLYPNDILARSQFRNGTFSNYNSLDLFYVGYGGNYNSTTRFRRYYAEFYDKNDSLNKPLIHAYTDKANLLEAGKWYHIVITVTQEITSYTINGKELFCIPIQPGDGNGYFGLRLFQNHTLFTGFNVKQL